MVLKSAEGWTLWEVDSGKPAEGFWLDAVGGGEVTV